MDKSKTSDQTTISNISYPQSVVPGTRAEGRSVWGNTQCADTVLMSKQDGHPCSFENVPNIYGVIIVAAKKKPS